MPDGYDQNRFRMALGDCPIGADCVFHDVLDSTNDALSAAAAKGAAHGAAVATDAQSKGRGRKGRVWQSPSGLNIYTSVLLRENLKADQLPFLVYLAGVAVAETVAPLLGRPPFLKWPNDVHVQGKKLCGILCESLHDRFGRGAILGIGLNVNADVDDFSPELREKAASLKTLTGRAQDRNAILAELYRAVDRLYKELSGDRDRIVKRWKALAELPDVEYIIDRDGRRIAGRAVDLAADGALVLREDSGAEKLVHHGDVIEYRRRNNHAAGH